MVRVLPKSNLVELETHEEVNKSKADEKEVMHFTVNKICINISFTKLFKMFMIQIEFKKRY